MMMMMMMPNTIMAILMLTLLRSSIAWIPTKPSTTTTSSLTHTTRIPYVVCRMSTPTPPEDEECPDEEECEIDWDKMPGFAEDDEPTTTTTQDSLFLNGPILYNDFEQDLQLDNDESLSFTTSFTPASIQRATMKQQSVEEEPVVVVSSIAAAASQQAANLGNFKRGLVNLEMNWQMSEAAAECNVDVPATCGSTECSSCSGAGTRVCRFCRGTHYMKFEGLNDFTACRICQPDGTETCQSCKGSGWIAEWTQMAPHTGGIPREINDDDDDDNRLLP